MARRAVKRLSAGGRGKKRDDEERQGGEEDGRVETVVGKSRELAFCFVFFSLHLLGFINSAAPELCRTEGETVLGGKNG